MRDAGFNDFRWVDAMLDPVEHDEPFWDDFMALAPITAFWATRAQLPGSPRQLRSPAWLRGVSGVR